MNKNIILLIALSINLSLNAMEKPAEEKKEVKTQVNPDIKSIIKESVEIMRDLSENLNLYISLKNQFSNNEITQEDVIKKIQKASPQIKDFVKKLNHLLCLIIPLMQEPNSIKNMFNDGDFEKILSCAALKKTSDFIQLDKELTENIIKFVKLLKPRPSKTECIKRLFCGCFYNEDID